MTKRELPKLIPFAIASIFVLAHIVEVFLKSGDTDIYGNTITYNVLDTVQYAGFGLAVVLTLILVNKSVWKQVFTILLILAFTPLIDFYHKIFSFGIGSLQLDITALALFTGHLILNPEVIPSFGSLMWTSSKERSQESIKDEFETAVNGFETRFQNKSKQELENMVSDGSLVPAAIEAAKRVLELK